MLKGFYIQINEAYGDNEYSELIYAHSKDDAHLIALKIAKQRNFYFPVIRILTEENYLRLEGMRK